MVFRRDLEKRRKGSLVLVNHWSDLLGHLKQSDMGIDKIDLGCARTYVLVYEQDGNILP